MSVSIDNNIVRFMKLQKKYLLLFGSKVNQRTKDIKTDKSAPPFSKTKQNKIVGTPILNLAMFKRLKVHTGSSCLMRISLLRISLLRIFKTFQIYFVTAIPYTLESGIDVGQGITVGPGKLVKKNKRRALNKRRA